MWILKTGQVSITSSKRSKRSWRACRWVRTNRIYSNIIAGRIINQIVSKASRIENRVCLNCNSNEFISIYTLCIIPLSIPYDMVDVVTHVCRYFTFASLVISYEMTCDQLEVFNQCIYVVCFYFLHHTYFSCMLFITKLYISNISWEIWFKNKCLVHINFCLRQKFVY